MKITKQQLKKIIKEELKKTLEEGAYDPYWVNPVTGEPGTDPQAETDRLSSKRLGRDHSSGYPIKCIPDKEGSPLGHIAVVDGHGHVHRIIEKNSKKCTSDTVAAHAAPK